MAVHKKFALGRGLDALISTEEVRTSGSSSINEVELSKISVNPNQPRRDFDPEALQELADSIAEIGIIQPITLRKISDDSYQIIAGERRFRASQMAGLTTIPAYIRTADDENVMEMAHREHPARRPELSGDCPRLPAFAGTVRNDAGALEPAGGKETHDHLELSPSAETPGTDSGRPTKERD